jgi:3',5'-cyclic AMP phosphodiesterase CpdA
MEPVLLAQLSDLHICEKWEGVDPVAQVERVVAAIRALPNPLDGVLVTGDLTDDGSAEHYSRARELLERLEAPLYVLPGNHDDRGQLRKSFELPGTAEEPVTYTAEVGGLRLVICDSIVPGQDAGAYSQELLRWIDETLAEQPEVPTLLALHHPPLPTGVPEWDAINLTKADREAMAEVVARHPQLRAIVGGHLHRTAAGTVGGCAVLSAPSACLQVRPNYEHDEVEFVEPPGFALHVLRDGELSSQVESLTAVKPND